MDGNNSTPQGGENGKETGAAGQNGNVVQTTGQNGNGGQIDYAKIQNMLDTATAKKETAVLKSYFQQQGLSEEEVSQAIANFKQNKQQQAQQQQNNNAELQNEVTAAQKLAEQAQIELAATKVAMGLGIDSKTLPYVLKMADLSMVKDKDGKVLDDSIKAALEKVLTDVPALKPSKESNAGFQLGAGQQSGGQTIQQAVNVPTKRWNRFN